MPPKIACADMVGIFQAVRMPRKILLPRDMSSTLSSTELVTAHRVVLLDCSACETNGRKQDWSGRLGININSTLKNFNLIMQSLQYQFLCLGRGSVMLLTGALEKGWV